MTWNWSSPNINLNGSSRQELQRQFIDISLAIRDARMKLQESMPHGRDYQTASDPVEALRLARAAFHERATTLHDMEVEFEGVALSMLD